MRTLAEQVMVPKGESACEPQMWEQQVKKKCRTVRTGVTGILRLESLDLKREGRK